MNYLIRKLKQDESKVLDTFLYEAIFIPEGVSAPSKDIINQPDLQVYVKAFGKDKGNLCLVAQVSDKIVGAVWVRIMNDYGHIDNETPPFAISLWGYDTCTPPEVLPVSSRHFLLFPIFLPHIPQKLPQPFL